MHPLRLMATRTTAPTKAPHAQDGPHYANASSKPLRGTGAADRGVVQRVTWKAFLIVLLCVLALIAVLSTVSHP